MPGQVRSGRGGDLGYTAYNVHSVVVGGVRGLLWGRGRGRGSGKGEGKGKGEGVEDS